MPGENRVSFSGPTEGFITADLTRSRELEEAVDTVEADRACKLLVVRTFSLGRRRRMPEEEKEDREEPTVSQS